MFTVPAAASAIPVPEPVPDVVMSTLGCSVPYATCQELTSGSSSVLPVSLIVVPPEPAEGGGVEDVEDGGFELLHAARTAAADMVTAANSGRRIRLITGDCSFA